MAETDLVSSRARRALEPSRTITIVSGLPRSGTSLMMQLLERAGLPLAVDGARESDADNPRGYYELEAVKAIHRDTGFLADSIGRTVKVVAPLLASLPGAYDYRVLFMERDLAEVLASQRAMLERVGRPTSELEDPSMRRAWSRQLERAKRWIDEHENTVVHFVSHRELIGSPEAVCADVAAFLSRTGWTLDTEAPRRMAAVVDPRLHRQRRQG